MVRMIKLGTRDMILTNDHLIPVDMIARAEFMALEVAEVLNVEQGAKIYLASEKEGLFLDLNEAKQLQALLRKLAT
jgi:hypothetical protein